MLSRSAERASNPPVLTPSLLSRIQRLNLEYLQLLLEPPLPSTCVHDESLSQALLRSLRRLSPQALQAIAAAPYALYTLGFEDQELWLDMLGTVPHDGLAGESPRESSQESPQESPQESLCVADDGATGCHVPRHAAFAQSVIFFAWHIAVVNPLAGRVMCGLPEAVCASLQAASFDRLQALMRTCPWLLMPRWSANPRFWPDLIKFATAGDPRAIRHTQLLGHQLIACDLRLAEAPPPELAGRLRAARSAQLQRWKLRPPG